MLGLVELHEIHMAALLKPVTTSGWHPFPLGKCGIVHKLAEGVLNPTVCVTDDRIGPNTDPRVTPLVIGMFIRD